LSVMVRIQGRPDRRRAQVAVRARCAIENPEDANLL
jgi:hypothetical protein